MKKPSLWVFGFGQFMEFFTPYIRPYFDIYIYDKNGKKEAIENLWVQAASLSQTASCDFVLLGYPAGAIAKLCQEIVPYIADGASVFDICSVQTPAVDAMKTYLPAHCNIFTIHPVFGPQSGKNGIKDLKCMFYNISCKEEVYQNFRDIFENDLGLLIFEMSPEEHDREMAYIQWLSHFIGRTLKKMSIPDAPLATNSYKHLRETSELVWYDSQDLFYSIQSDNPFVAEVREQFLKEIHSLNTWIQNKNI